MSREEGNEGRERGKEKACWVVSWTASDISHKIGETAAAGTTAGTLAAAATTGHDGSGGGGAGGQRGRAVGVRCKKASFMAGNNIVQFSVEWVQEETGIVACDYGNPDDGGWRSRWG